MICKSFRIWSVYNLSISLTRESMWDWFFSIFSFHFTLIVLAVVTAGYYIIFSEWFHYFFHTKCALLKCQVNITFIRNKVEVLNIHLGLNIGLYCGV